ncbi:hypothetical protein HDU97_000694 [Phlyctochytrium planicorne]|nr:hypothetical protein HDU97_000694 [Phlyctochytrium planicorne]
MAPKAPDTVVMENAEDKIRASAKIKKDVKKPQQAGKTENANSLGKKQANAVDQSVSGSVATKPEGSFNNSAILAPVPVRDSVSKAGDHEQSDALPVKDIGSSKHAAANFVAQEDVKGDSGPMSISENSTFDQFFDAPEQLPDEMKKKEPFSYSSEAGNGKFLTDTANNVSGTSTMVAAVSENPKQQLHYTTSQVHSKSAADSIASTSFRSPDILKTLEKVEATGLQPPSNSEQENRPSTSPTKEEILVSGRQDLASHSPGVLQNIDISSERESESLVKSDEYQNDSEVKKSENTALPNSGGEAVIPSVDPSEPQPNPSYEKVPKNAAEEIAQSVAKGETTEDTIYSVYQHEQSNIISPNAEDPQNKRTDFSNALAEGQTLATDPRNISEIVSPKADTSTLAFTLPEAKPPHRDNSRADGEKLIEMEKSATSESSSAKSLSPQHKQSSKSASRKISFDVLGSRDIAKDSQFEPSTTNVEGIADLSYTYSSSNIDKGSKKTQSNQDIAKPVEALESAVENETQSHLESSTESKGEGVDNVETKPTTREIIKQDSNSNIASQHQLPSCNQSRSASANFLGSRGSVTKADSRISLTKTVTSHAKPLEEEKFEQKASASVEREDVQEAEHRSVIQSRVSLEKDQLVPLESKAESRSGSKPYLASQSQLYGTDKNPQIESTSNVRSSIVEKEVLEEKHVTGSTHELAQSHPTAQDAVESPGNQHLLKNSFVSRSGSKDQLASKPQTRAGSGVNSSRPSLVRQKSGSTRDNLKNSSHADVDNTITDKTFSKTNISSQHDLGLQRLIKAKSKDSLSQAAKIYTSGSKPNLTSKSSSRAVSAKNLALRGSTSKRISVNNSGASEIHAEQQPTNDLFVNDGGASFPLSSELDNGGNAVPLQHTKKESDLEHKIVPNSTRSEDNSLHQSQIANESHSVTDDSSERQSLSRSPHGQEEDVGRGSSNARTSSHEVLNKKDENANGRPEHLALEPSSRKASVNGRESQTKLTGSSIEAKNGTEIRQIHHHKQNLNQPGKEEVDRGLDTPSLDTKAESENAHEAEHNLINRSRASVAKDDPVPLESKAESRSGSKNHLASQSQIYGTDLKPQTESSSILRSSVVEKEVLEEKHLIGSIHQLARSHPTAQDAVKSIGSHHSLKNTYVSRSGSKDQLASKPPSRAGSALCQSRPSLGRQSARSSRDQLECISNEVGTTEMVKNRSNILSQNNLASTSLLKTKSRDSLAQAAKIYSASSRLTSKPTSRAGSARSLTGRQSANRAIAPTDTGKNTERKEDSDKHGNKAAEEDMVPLPKDAHTVPSDRREGSQEYLKSSQHVSSDTMGLDLHQSRDHFAPSMDGIAAIPSQSTHTLSKKVSQSRDQVGPVETGRSDEFISDHAPAQEPNELAIERGSNDKIDSKVMKNGAVEKQELTGPKTPKHSSRDVLNVHEGSKEGAFVYGLKDGAHSKPQEPLESLTSDYVSPRGQAQMETLKDQLASADASKNELSKVEGSSNELASKHSLKAELAQTQASREQLASKHASKDELISDAYEHKEHVASRHTSAEELAQTRGIGDEIASKHVSRDELSQTQGSRAELTSKHASKDELSFKAEVSKDQLAAEHNEIVVNSQWSKGQLTSKHDSKDQLAQRKGSRDQQLASRHSSNDELSSKAQGSRDQLASKHASKAELTQTHQQPMPQHTSKADLAQGSEDLPGYKHASKEALGLKSQGSRDQLVSKHASKDEVLDQGLKDLKHDSNHQLAQTRASVNHLASNHGSKDELDSKNHLSRDNIASGYVPIDESSVSDHDRESQHASKHELSSTLGSKNQIASKPELAANGSSNDEIAKVQESHNQIASRHASKDELSSKDKGSIHQLASKHASKADLGETQGSRDQLTSRHSSKAGLVQGSWDLLASKLVSKSETSSKSRGSRDQLTSAHASKNELSTAKGSSNELASKHSLKAELAQTQASREQLASKHASKDELISDAYEHKEHVAAKQSSAEELSQTRGIGDEIASKHVSKDELSQTQGSRAELTSKHASEDELSFKAEGSKDQLAAKHNEIAANVQGSKNQLASKHASKDQLVEMKGSRDQLASRNSSKDELSSKAQGSRDQLTSKHASRDELALKSKGSRDKLASRHASKNELNKTVGSRDELGSQLVSRDLLGLHSASKDELAALDQASKGHIATKDSRDQLRQAKGSRDQLASRHPSKDAKAHGSRDQLSSKHASRDGLAFQSNRSRDKLESTHASKNELIQSKGSRDQLALSRDSKDELNSAIQSSRDQLVSKHTLKDEVTAIDEESKTQLAFEHSSKDELVKKQAPVDNPVSKHASKVELAQPQGSRDQLASRHASKDELSSKIKGSRDQLSSKHTSKDELAFRAKGSREKLASRNASADQLGKAQGSRDQLASKQASRDEFTSKVKGSKEQLSSKPTSKDNLAHSSPESRDQTSLKQTSEEHLNRELAADSLPLENGSKDNLKDHVPTEQAGSRSHSRSGSVKAQSIRATSQSHIANRASRDQLASKPHSRAGSVKKPSAASRDHLAKNESNDQLASKVSRNSKDLVTSKPHSRAGSVRRSASKDLLTQNGSKDHLLTHSHPSTSNLEDGRAEAEQSEIAQENRQDFISKEALSAQEALSGERTDAVETISRHSLATEESGSPEQSKSTEESEQMTNVASRPASVAGSMKYSARLASEAGSAKSESALSVNRTAPLTERTPESSAPEHDIPPENSTVEDFIAEPQNAEDVNKPQSRKPSVRDVSRPPSATGSAKIQSRRGSAAGSLRPSSVKSSNPVPPSDSTRVSRTGSALGSARDIARPASVAGSAKDAPAGIEKQESATAFARAIPLPESKAGSIRPGSAAGSIKNDSRPESFAERMAEPEVEGDGTKPPSRVGSVRDIPRPESATGSEKVRKRPGSAAGSIRPLSVAGSAKEVPLPEHDNSGNAVRDETRPESVTAIDKEAVVPASDRRDSNTSFARRIPLPESAAASIRPESRAGSVRGIPRPESAAASIKNEGDSERVEADHVHHSAEEASKEVSHSTLQISNGSNQPLEQSANVTTENVENINVELSEPISKPPAQNSADELAHVGVPANSVMSNFGNMPAPEVPANSVIEYEEDGVLNKEQVDSNIQDQQNLGSQKSLAEKVPTPPVAGTPASRKGSVARESTRKSQPIDAKTHGSSYSLKKGDGTPKSIRNGDLTPRSVRSVKTTEELEWGANTQELGSKVELAL